MRPAPILADSQRLTKPIAASKTAIPATTEARPTTRSSSRARMPWSMISRRISGLTTVITASITVSSRNVASSQR